jgi:hypothetical protein
MPLIQVPQEELERQLNNQEICLRCGMSKKDIKKDNCGCKSWGTYYKKHIYK